MERLRDCLQRELGENECCLPVGDLIRKCYRELLLRAVTIEREPTAPGNLERKLREIAAEFLDQIRVKHP